MKRLEKQFPLIRYIAEDLAENKSAEEKYKIWLDLVVKIAQIIENQLIADTSQVIWTYGTSMVGYFDYETSYMTAYLKVNLGIKCHIFGESDLQYEREGEDYLSLSISNLPEKSEIKAKILIKSPHFTDFEIKTTEENLKLIEAFLNSLA